MAVTDDAGAPFFRAGDRDRREHTVSAAAQRAFSATSFVFAVATCRTAVRRAINVSVPPTFEAFNVFNESAIFQYASGTWATTGGNYLIPSSVLQSRILGFGVQVRW